MIASFRQSRFSLVFAALVVAVGLVTLTDARAGEPMIRRQMSKEPASPAMLDILQKLETPISAEFESVTIDDVLHQITTATAVNITVAEGAIDDATRGKHLNIKARNIPAHMVLVESLGTLHLTVKISETGAVVLRAPEGEEMRMRTPNGEEMRLRTPEGDGDGRVMIRRTQEEPAGNPDANVIVQKIVDASVEGEGGSGKRKLTLRTDHGEEEGSLEIELVEKQ